MERLKKHPLRWIGIGIALLIVAIALLFPLTWLLKGAFIDDAGSWVGLRFFRDYFDAPHLVSALCNSLWVAVVASILAFIPAFGAAWAVSRTRMRGKTIFRQLFMLPLLAPTMMQGIALIYLLGQQGILRRLGIELPLYGPLGIILAEGVSIFPLMFLILALAFEQADRRLYEAAEVMGCTPLRTFMSVTLPAMRNATLNALLVGFCFAFTDFGAPKVLGGNFNILPVDLYKAVIGTRDFHTGAVAAMFLMIPALIAFWLERRLSSANSGTLSAKALPLVIAPKPTRDWIGFLLCLIPALGMLGLLACMGCAAFCEYWPYQLNFTWRHFNFSSVMPYGTSEVVTNSLMVAALTALGGTAATFAAAYVLVKTTLPRWISGLLHGCFQLPLTVPGLALGIAFILFFNNPLNPLHGLYGTVAILVLVNVVHFFSVPYLTARSGLARIDKEMESAAACCGRSRASLLCKVTLPIMMPTLAENFIYFAINAMTTVSAVILLYPAAFPIGSVAIINMEDAGEIPAAAALSLLIVGINLAIRLLGEITRYLLQHRQRHWRGGTS